MQICCEYNNHIFHEITQCGLTADSVTPQEGVCACICSKISSLVAKSHEDCATGSLDIKNGWIIFGQNLYFHLHQAAMITLIYVKKKKKNE